MSAPVKAERLYDEDFYAWTQAQARELRRLKEVRLNLPLDLDHLAEEVEDLGKEQRNKVRSHVRQILVHLLMLSTSPSRQPQYGWRAEIQTWRAEIDDRITPTIRHGVLEYIDKLFAQAVRLAQEKLSEHGEAAAARALPEKCPYTFDQILGDWWPEERADDVTKDEG